MIFFPWSLYIYLLKFFSKVEFFLPYLFIHISVNSGIYFILQVTVK